MTSDPRSAQHFGSGLSDPTPPEPSYAERARTLIHLARVGTLSTLSQKVAGFPFGSVAPYAVDATGQPTLLFSTRAMHTQNLLADGRASLLVTQPGWTDDPLAGARVTLIGTLAAIASADLAGVRDAYLARHDNARHWVDFADFNFYQLQVVDLYFVAGFGAMGWVDAADYLSAAPDPLADSASGILDHMNADHSDALVLYCRAFAAIEAQRATMTAIDRLGFRVRAETRDQPRSLRINYPREARSAQEVRAALIEMVAEARAKLPDPKVT